MYVGIDPGQDGAVVCLDKDGNFLSYLKFIDWYSVGDLFQSFKIRGYSPKVCIEKLWGMPLRGSQGNFSLGGNYTAYKALLDINRISYIEISPATWQPKILNTSKKKSKETKPLAIQFVNQKYPTLQMRWKKPKDIKEFSGIADATCIALYGRSVDLGNI